MISPDGNHLLVDMRGAVFDFDTHSGKELRRLQPGRSNGSMLSHDGRILAVSVVADKETILANGAIRHETGKADRLRLLQLDTGELIREIAA